MIIYLNLEGYIELPCEKPKPKGIFITIKKTGGENANKIYDLCEVEVYSANMSLTNQGLFNCFLSFKMLTLFSSTLFEIGTCLI